tara:strand:+ start:14331 stop:14954 length:624 start_codon:yes stop_codon:yes gene_type:complete
MTDVINLRKKYESLCKEKSDINEHLPTIYNLAKDCESIIELGVRGVVSSYALTYGLVNNNSNIKKLFLNDIQKCDINELLINTKNINIDVSYQWINDLDLEIEHNYDMTFIDTWHVYAQLKRELKKFSRFTNKYIIMHDTQIDGILGETIRNKWNALEQSKKSGFNIDEINKGLKPAIDEFLANNKNWKLKQEFTNNNGLTILEKII